MTTKRGLVFQAEIIEDDTLFFEDKFQTIPRCPRYKKKCVFTDPEGGAWTALLAPRLSHPLHLWRELIHFWRRFSSSATEVLS